MSSLLALMSLLIRAWKGWSSARSLQSTRSRLIKGWPKAFHRRRRLFPAGVKINHRVDLLGTAPSSAAANERLFHPEELTN